MQKTWWVKDLVVTLFSLLFPAAFSYELSYAGKLCLSVLANIWKFSSKAMSEEERDPRTE